MYESSRLAKLLAVLLGVVLWLPGLESFGSKLAQPTEPAISCAHSGGSPVGEVDPDEAPSEVSESESDKDAETSSIDELGLFAQWPNLTTAACVRVGVLEYEREWPPAAHDVLARERGPPIA